MNLILVLILFLTIWLTFGLWSVTRRAREVRPARESVDELRQRIRTLEAIITDQERQLRRDFDGLA